MAYSYLVEKNSLFTDDGQRMFLKIRDRANQLLTQAGAFRMMEVFRGAGSGDSFTMLACVDRMVELGEIKELTGHGCCGQHRTFVRVE